MTAGPIAVGVHVHAEPERLRATLAALALPGRRPLEILILPDGADPETARFLATLDAPRSATREPLGAPACFNRLVSATTAGVAILLESGAVPAPGTVDRLADALDAGARVGLAGPSTNAAWNEQCAFPHSGGDPATVAATAVLAARRYGTAISDLAPLYSLSDFCYAVRRDVIEAIGGADEGYGLAPCWEMEYSARAVRAGFRAVWVRGAFAYRAPFTARRRSEEARRFEAGRRRYQDSLCALRLRGTRAGYEAHCRGDACEFFAPREEIQLRRPLAASARVEFPPAAAPLVSCIMPTRDRADFALHAVRLFQRQEHRERELLIVDDGDDGLQARLPDDPRIRYLRAPPGETIGAKRNRAAAESRGDFLAQWDDDDWYGPKRLSAQLEPLAAGRADITALRTPVFFELDRWRFWTCTDALHRRLFVGDVHGGTLVFSRRVWADLARYPDASLAEDAAFLTRAKLRGARLERIEGEGLFAYLRHSRNAWSFRCGEFIDGTGWLPADEPDLPPDDRAFYAASSAAAPADPQTPLVSCIMPTADRRRWVPKAIEYFLRQDYPRRELIVLDDGADRVADLIPPDPRIRYVALDAPVVLGDKRNRACELARGDLIVHWDDDDWHAPHRLRYQVGELARHGAELCGPSQVVFFDATGEHAWLYEYPSGGRPWVAGGGLCYRRGLWQENRFAPVAVGEDTRFVWSPRVGTPLVLGDHHFFAGLVHPANTSRKPTGGACWRPWPLEQLRALLGEDWAGYAPAEA